MTIQIPALVLPDVSLALAFTGAETETVADLLIHTGYEFSCEHLQNKEVTILATEFLPVGGVPGNLFYWIEQGPYPGALGAPYWSILGGVVPPPILAAGVHLRQHVVKIPWTAHSSYARVRVQTPIAAFLPAAFWLIQAGFSGYSPVAGGG